jgi:Uma2 family endonuclease
MGETDVHRQCMFDLIESLKIYFRGQRVYVSGNLLLFYERGNKRKHVSPDVFVVKEADPHPRDNYLLWEEGKGPDVVIEVTSPTTRKEDLNEKFELYRDVLTVPEYFLFDPRAEYLKPSLRGFQLQGTNYVQIEPMRDRLPSSELGLHLENNGNELRLFDAESGRWIPTPHEARLQAEQEVERLKARLAMAETKRHRDAKG